jgi:hypothetical protein
MADIFLERLDAAPVIHEDFSFEMMQWLTLLTDQMNATLEQIQEALNDLDARVTALGG